MAAVLCTSRKRSNGLPWPAEGPALGYSPCQTSTDALDDPRALELGDRAKDVHLELAGWRRRIDAFGQADEGDTQRL
jgi:hypothetical protein